MDLNDDDYDIDDSYDDGDEVDGRAGRAFGEESFDTFAGMPDDDDFDDDEYDSWRLEVDASTPTHGKKQGSGRKGSDDGSETLTSGRAAGGARTSTTRTTIRMRTSRRVQRPRNPPRMPSSARR